MKPDPNKIDPNLFLRFLKEEEIDEIYRAPILRGGRPATAPSQVKNSIPVAPPEQGAKAPGPKSDLLMFREKVQQCTLCSELARTRKNVVFGSGNAKARLMFVGEAPGHDENVQGLPFVGKAGQLLTKIIESIGLDRRQVFIANVLKCRPPGNRAPQPDEILNCEPYLKRQIELIRPQIICALGTFAAQTLLKTGEPISKLRGRLMDFQGSKLICTFHPAYLLRNPEEKRKVWEDMKMIKRELSRHETESEAPH